jgi:hypothetical protein
LLTTLLMALQLGFAAAARAGGGGDFQLDFAAATPGTYNQSTGTGGQYGDGGTDNVVESLEGGDFVCGDIVQFLTAVTVDEDAEGTQSISINYTFATEPTGQPGVGYTDVVYASLNPGDSGNIGLDTNETVVLASEGTSGEDLTATVDVTGLDAGEQLIVSVGVQLGCTDAEGATGNVLAALESAETSQGDPIQVGNQTIPLMVQGITEPEPEPGVAVVKECPDVVTVGGEITYTVTITNTGEEPLEDIQVVDSLFGDVSDLFADTLDVGESDTVVRSITAPENLAGETLTNEITVTATGAESEVEATASAACETEIREPGGPGEEPELPVTGLSDGLPLAWILILSLAVVGAGAGLRVAARRRG